MYYEDQSKRINVLSGLAAGAVLGVGLALLFQPEPPRRRRPPLSNRVKGAALRGARRGLEAAGETAVRMAVRRFHL